MRFQTAKRPTSASSTSSNSRSAPANQRARSNSSSGSIASGRQTPTATRPSLKNKLTKPTNNTQPAKATTAALPTHSNLLGKVDLDDEDDLLAKYQPKKPLTEVNETNHRDELRSSLNKFNSNLQTMIDTKWNQYKTNFQHEEEEEDAAGLDEEEDFYPKTRQRTSSRSSGVIHIKGSAVQPRKVREIQMIDIPTNACECLGFRRFRETRTIC